MECFLSLKEKLSLLLAVRISFTFFRTPVVGQFDVHLTTSSHTHTDQTAGDITITINVHIICCNIVSVIHFSCRFVAVTDETNSTEWEEFKQFVYYEAGEHLYFLIGAQCLFPSSPAQLSWELPRNDCLCASHLCLPSNLFDFIMAVATSWYEYQKKFYFQICSFARTW